MSQQLFQLIAGTLAKLDRGAAAAALDKAIDLAQADIHRRLTEALGDEAAIYYGTP